MLVQHVINNYICNLTELKMKTKIVKCIEYSYICFWFKDSFKVEDIPDNFIINMLDNIENRI